MLRTTIHRLERAGRRSQIVAADDEMVGASDAEDVVQRTVTAEGEGDERIRFGVVVDTDVAAVDAFAADADEEVVAWSEMGEEDSHMESAADGKGAPAAGKGMAGRVYAEFAVDGQELEEGLRKDGVDRDAHTDNDVEVDGQSTPVLEEEGTRCNRVIVKVKALEDPFRPLLLYWGIVQFLFAEQNKQDKV
ncbi:hypothetical protein HK097_010120 [Rhizophlyctis rosea]|uniref:Uncharacterized protein n=1 Tax=Rhizophlyctis rosea TaxID=64517 RepID=A0AAD5X2S4_9FUNG|nr:hypothetical protein HK097_010120 [Rhizophlyctis rosea]